MLPRRAAINRNALLLAASLALLGFAGFYGWSNWRGEDAAPDDAGSAVGFVCEKCGTYFELTARALEVSLRKKEFAAAGPRLMIACQKCGEKTAVRAALCPRHGEVINLNPQGKEPTGCSKCGFRGP